MYINKYLNVTASCLIVVSI